MPELEFWMGVKYWADSFIEIAMRRVGTVLNFSWKLFQGNYVTRYYVTHVPTILLHFYIVNKIN